MNPLPTIAALLLFAASTGVAAEFPSLLGKSPFTPSASGTTTATTEAGAPEYRSYVVEEGRTYFSIYDPGTQRSYWLEQGKEEDGFSVQSFNEKEQTITVLKAGRSLVLSLKKETIVASAAPVPTPSLGQPGQPQVQPGAGGAAGTANRLEAVAAEVRRRRALRQSGQPAQQPPPPQPAPSGETPPLPQ